MIDWLEMSYWRFRNWFWMRMQELVLRMSPELVEQRRRYHIEQKGKSL